MLFNPYTISYTTNADGEEEVHGDIRYKDILRGIFVSDAFKSGKAITKIFTSRDHPNLIQYELGSFATSAQHTTLNNAVNGLNSNLTALTTTVNGLKTSKQDAMTAITISGDTFDTLNFK